MGSSSSKIEEEKRKELERKRQEEEDAKKKCLETKAMLEEKIKKSEEIYDANFKQVKELENEAREKLKSGDKVGAKRCLAKKKKLQQMNENLNNQMMMMDDQLIALENAVNFGTIMATIKDTNDILKGNQVTLDQIQEEGEKIQENKNITEQIQGVIENQVNEDDGDDLLDELENELKKEVKLPSAYKGKLKESENIKNLDDELNLMSL